MITKSQLGEELKKELAKGFDITRLSRWSYKIFFNNSRELSAELKETLEYLFRMEDDPQFEYSEDELNLLAKKLIDGEENPIKQINEMRCKKP